MIVRKCCDSFVILYMLYYIHKKTKLIPDKAGEASSVYIEEGTNEQKNVALSNGKCC